MQVMNSAPQHARRRRYRLLVLIFALFAVSALSPRLRTDFRPPADEMIEEVVGHPMIAMRLPEPAVARADVRRALAEADAEDLFAFVDAPVDAAEIEARMPAPTRRIHYVVLNPVLLQAKTNVFWEPRGRLQVPLPDGTRVEVEIQHTEALGPDRFTSHGRIMGDPLGRAVFAYYGGRLAARIDTKEGSSYELRPVADESGEVVNEFYEIDPDLVPDCGGELEVTPDDDMMRLAETDATATTVTQADAASEGTTGPILDVMMVYTSALREGLGSTELVQVQLDLGMAQVNADFAASAITARVRLAGSLEVAYAGDEIATSSAGWQSTALTRLRGETDGFMDEVHARRDALGADLVCLLLKRPDSDSSGIAYILDQPRDYAGPYFGFSVVNAALMSSSVLSHELGHNLGAAHAQGDSGTTNGSGGAYAYSYGYRFTASTGVRYRTIMAYSPGTRIGYFSNPRLRLPTLQADGSSVMLATSPALGVAEGNPGAADNARTIELNAFQVANFRRAAVGSDRGRLINVSTRALVGANERQMIGGFVLSGSGTRNVLIRAVGPALAAAPFNVAGTLADPALLVVDGRTGAAVAGNDNWGLPATNAIGLANAARQAGAFALPNGSADAALQLSLAPGSYTAVVSGNGGTGVALIEAYAVDAGTSKPVNLSTRAYGSSVNPIVAGFVVREDPTAPGQRKRMLIRVLGPSLAGFGLGAGQVMADPLLQLYGAQGELLLENDDWDPPSTSFGANIRPTARGSVDQPGERAVYDAYTRLNAGGMTPVEPGVVVDLTPGAYTVMVTPFEKLPSQPGVPGVALVEVFELPPD